MDRIPGNKPSDNTRNRAKHRYEFNTGPSDNTRKKVRFEGDVPHRETPLKPDSNVNLSLDDHSAIINFERDIPSFDKEAKAYQARFEALKQKYQDYAPRLNELHSRWNRYAASANLYFSRKALKEQIAELKKLDAGYTDLSVPASIVATHLGSDLDAFNQVEIDTPSSSDSEDEQIRHRSLTQLQDRFVEPINTRRQGIEHSIAALRADLDRMNREAHGLSLPEHLTALSTESNQLRNHFASNSQEGLGLEQEKQPLLRDYPRLEAQREKLKEVQQKRTRLLGIRPEESYEAILADSSLSSPESLPTVRRRSRQRAE